MWWRCWKFKFLSVANWAANACPTLSIFNESLIFEPFFYHVIFRLFQLVLASAELVLHQWSHYPILSVVYARRSGGVGWLEREEVCPAFLARPEVGRNSYSFTAELVFCAEVVNMYRFMRPSQALERYKIKYKSVFWRSFFRQWAAPTIFDDLIGRFVTSLQNIMQSNPEWHLIQSIFHKFMLNSPLFHDFLHPFPRVCDKGRKWSAAFRCCRQVDLKRHLASKDFPSLHIYP